MFSTARDQRDLFFVPSANQTLVRSHIEDRIFEREQVVRPSAVGRVMHGTPVAGVVQE